MRPLRTQPPCLVANSCDFESYSRLQYAALQFARAGALVPVLQRFPSFWQVAVCCRLAVAENSAYVLDDDALIAVVTGEGSLETPKPNLTVDPSLPKPSPSVEPLLLESGDSVTSGLELQYIVVVLVLLTVGAWQWKVFRSAMKLGSNDVVLPSLVDLTERDEDLACLRRAVNDVRIALATLYALVHQHCYSTDRMLACVYRPVSDDDATQEDVDRLRASLHAAELAFVMVSW